MKTYSNRYASIEQQPGGTWIVFSEVSGLPVYVDDNADEPTIKLFADYSAARAAMIEMTQRYAAIERGRR